MRRGESKAKDAQRGGRTRSAATKTKTRAERKDASSGSLAVQLAAKTRELNEALAQQTATADVLKVISRSAFDLQAVLDTLVESIGRLCRADQAGIRIAKDGIYRHAASYGYSPETKKFHQEHPISPTRGTIVGRVALERKTIHIADLLGDAEFTYRDAPEMHRTMLAVPMFKDDKLIGVIGVFRLQVEPFTDRQIELAQTFADQAVIAIENARLFDEVQARTKELTESLEQQTATSQVLQVISSSPGELKPVFHAMLENATRLCEAKFGSLLLREGDAFRSVAHHNAPLAYAEERRRNPLIRPKGAFARVAMTKRVVHIPDLRAEQAYLDGNPSTVTLANTAGARAVLLVPMLKEDDLIGVINIFRQEVRPFTDKQIELVQSFADQAVIAIENTRLLNELRESLEQQTATSDVLQVISSSPGELGPVFEKMLESATRVCNAKFGSLLLQEGGVFRYVAQHNVPSALAELMRCEPRVRAPPDSPLDRMARTKQVVHVADVRKEEAYIRGAAMVRVADVGGARTTLYVPMLKEDELIGVIGIYRQEVQPFSDKQIELVSNFANQAVIAIENTRLLKELRQRTADLTESLDQQTATSEVLGVISSSPGELEPVFKKMLENATRVCSAEFGTMLLQEDRERFRHVALHNMAPAFIEFVGRNPIIRSRSDGLLGRVAQAKQPVHVADFRDTPAYHRGDESARVLADAGGARSALGVPLLKEGELVGVIGIFRQEVRPFTDKQIELVSNFAKQAVIAIENTRLLKELRQRTDDLTESLEQQTATSDVLQVISSSPGELEPVFQAMLENAVRICEANCGNLFLYEQGSFRIVAMQNPPPAYREEWQREPVIITGENQRLPLARLAETKEVLHVADLTAEPGYLERDQRVVALVDSAGLRTMLLVPMLKESDLIGAIVIYRQEVRSFTDKQIELIRNFANQAVIAIENARLLKELRQRTDDLTESLEQQTATSDVLQVISNSPGELAPVFETMLAKAIALCEASFGAMWLFDGDGYRTAALHGDLPEAYVEQWRSGTLHRPKADVPMARAIRSRMPVHVPDMLKEKAYLEGDPLPVSVVNIAGIRSLVTVPMLKDAEAIGVITIYRKEVRSFTDKQIELVSNFAKQAVIAIENTRLLNKLRESLEQQTATSEVLSVISSSPGELEPVFQSMLENALRICEAKFGVMFRSDQGQFKMAAMLDLPPPFAEFLQRDGGILSPPSPGTVLDRVLQTKKVAHVADGAAIQFPSPAAKLGGARSTVAVPMLKDDELVGAFVIYRQEVRPFTDKQIDLVQNFANQAVIAIENARLLKELRERTGELARSVDELRALGDVSQAVNSTLDLKTVLDTIVAKAVQLSGTEAGTIYEFDEYQRDLLFRSTYGMDDAVIAELREHHIGIVEPTIDQAVRTCEPVQVPDLRDIPATPARDIASRAGYRALLVVPLLARDHVVGVLVVRRKAPGAFSQDTVDLLKTFAAQSVLAIQNAHLFTEIDEKSRQVEIASQHKSQFLANMSHELRTPLNAILGYTELILDNIYGETPDKMREVLDRLQANGKHLLGLINDVLDLSKIEAGELALDLADYSLKEVVQTVFTAVELLATGKKLALTIDVAPKLPVGHGDERRLVQVLLNLVGNAIKFTDKGEVAIKATMSDGSFTVAVRDTGPGISPSDQGKIFEEFQQADNSATKRKGGTGLGLSIAKRIIGMHGGRIWVESDVGKGSTFAFTIPVRVDRQVSES